MSFERGWKGGAGSSGAHQESARRIGKHTLASGLEDAPVQRAADGAAPDAATTHAAAQRGIAGGGAALPHLNIIQRAFGRHDVSGVAAHVGGAAAEASQAMGARAYATGNHVAFGASPDLHTAAHEAAHVVQQRAGVHLKDAVGKTGDSYEQHADAVADQVVRGESAEGLLDQMSGSGGGSAVQLLATSGGDFAPSNYSPVTSGALRGTSIEITFTPNDLVVAPKLGLTQTLKSSKGGTPYYLGAPAESAERRARSTTASQGDEGRQIDRVTERTNPMYGLNNPPPGTGLEGTAASGGNARVGHRTVDGGGHVDMAPAWMSDEPKLNWPGVGTAMEQIFETTALVMEGAMSGTYLGSVEWGVRTEAATGVPTSLPFRVVSQGVPTQHFMAAATNWNAQSIWQRDRIVAAGPGTVASRAALVAGTAYPASTLVMTIQPAAPSGGTAPPPVELRLPVDDTFESFLVADAAPVIAGQQLAVYRSQQATVDLPTTTHQTVDPATLNDEQLDQRMRALTAELAPLDPTTADYRNKRFEYRSLSRVGQTRGTGAVDSGHTYAVQGGETLWSIAVAHLGGGARWTRILALNMATLQEPGGFRVGLALHMPQPYAPAPAPAPPSPRHTERGDSSAPSDPSNSEDPSQRAQGEGGTPV